MNIPEAIAVLRNRIRDFTDDSTFTDEMLYNELLIKRNKYMSQRYRKYLNISEAIKSTYCTPMELDVSHDCDCVRVGCKVVKSVFKIPRTLSGRNHDLIKVYDLAYNEIPQVTPNEQKSNMLDPIKAGQMTYSFLNRKIVLWNSPINEDANEYIKGILVEGVWEDETEWDGITLCDYLESGSDSIDNCFDLDNTIFAIEADLLDMVIQEATDVLMNAPMRIIQDNTNDSNPEIKA